MGPEHKNTILIVDDDSLCVRFLVNVLCNDYVMFVAKSGREGINMAMNQQPDLIILDIEMPGLSGHEVIAALRHMRETENIPVIFYTSLVAPSDAALGLRLGAVDYINKEFKPDEIKARIQSQIQLAKANSSSKR